MGVRGGRPSGLVSGGGCRRSVPLGAPVGAAVPAGGFARPAPAPPPSPPPPPLQLRFPQWYFGSCWQAAREEHQWEPRSRSCPGTSGREGRKEREKARESPEPSALESGCSPAAPPVHPPNAPGFSPHCPHPWHCVGPTAHPIGASLGFGVGGGCKPLFFFFPFGLNLAHTDGMATGGGESQTEAKRKKKKEEEKGEQ